ncbi:MAG: tetratricopeptide repeat protein [Spirochaetaceae bacterium]|jgi:Flp pilus assembly protein TadD|nr:tetratricopeptide repeat protein [Spirochaetaceae bacterium]
MNNNTFGAKFMLLAFAFTALAFVSAGAQVHNKDYYYDRAHWRLTTGNAAGALEDLNLIVSLTPDDSRAYNTRGIIYEKSGDYSAARADYEHALRINPDSAEAIHNINNLNEKLRNLNLVNAGSVPPGYTQQPYAPSRTVQQTTYTPVQAPRQQTYTSATPSRTVQQTTYTPGQASRQQTYTSVAPSRTVQQTTYTPAQAVQYTDDRGFSNTPVSGYYRQNANVGMFRQTGVPTPGGYGTVLQPAVVQAGVNVYEQPVAYRAPVRKAFIDANAEACNSYGLTLNGYGRFEEAVVKFTEAVDLYPEYAIAYNNRGVAYAAMGDFVRATEDFIRALRINPYYYDAQVNYQRINGTTNVAVVTQ